MTPAPIPAEALTAILREHGDDRVPYGPMNAYVLVSDLIDEIERLREEVYMLESDRGRRERLSRPERGQK